MLGVTEVNERQAILFVIENVRHTLSHVPLSANQKRQYYIDLMMDAFETFGCDPNVVVDVWSMSLLDSQLND